MGFPGFQLIFGGILPEIFKNQFLKGKLNKI